MDSMKESGLTFPQRHWLILCIVVAILSPIVVHAIQTMAHKTNYNEAIEPKRDTSAAGAMPASAKDTTYKVAAPPQSK
jgi:multisubunit Na+/H+ antiporter MnhG subunit